VHLDLECLESFLILAQEQHYGRAAARLQVTPPALSKRIRRLERQLNVQLLQRGGAGVLGLTPAGVRVATEGEMLLDHERALRRAALGKATTVTLGIPRLGANGKVDRSALSEVRRLLRLQHPDVALVCRWTPLSITTTWLLEKRVDVQLFAGTIGHPKVRATAVGSVPRVAVVSARSQWVDEGRLSIDDLVDQPMLYDPSLPTEFMRPFWLGDVRPAEQARLVGIASSEYRSVLQHVAMGSGVTVLLPAQAKEISSGVRALPIEGVPSLALQALRLLSNRESPAESLVNALQAVPRLIG
jgi:DNA-binding transcriptional LysR family regulator